MPILDRYIARQYLINIVVLFLVLFCFVVAIDASWNLDRFFRIAAELSDRDGDEGSGLRRTLITALLVLDLWWPRLLQLYNFMLGLILVGAMGFTCAQLVRHRELVAVLASGQSLHRVARPILLVALGMTALMAANQELVLPRIAPLLTRDQGDAGKRALGTSNVPLTADGAGRLWYARSFDADLETVEDVYIWDRDQDGLARRRIYAPRATWRNGGWDLQGGRAEGRAEAVGDGTGTVGSGIASGEPVDRVETDLSPLALKIKRYEGYSQNLSWRQLDQMLDRTAQADTAKRDRLERTQFGRISIMLANLLSLVVALPFFVTREPRNMVVQSLKCAPIAIAALLGGVLGASAPVPGLPAALGVFIPVMILAPVAVAMASAVRT